MVRAAEEFQTLGSTHLAAVAVAVVGVAAIVALGSAHRNTFAAIRFSRVLAVVVPVVTVPLQVVQLLPSEWNFDTSLPLQLCDLAWIAATIALWTHRPWAVALTYFWGITLTTQAMLTPALDTDFPDPRYVMFWAMHLLVVWSACYLTFGIRLGPGWREYRTSVAVTAVWAAAVFCFNLATGANYGYLNRKPAGASALDLLGPWPVYVFAEIAIILAVWALMTWPWAAARSRQAIARE